MRPLPPATAPDARFRTPPLLAVDRVLEPVPTLPAWYQKDASNSVPITFVTVGPSNDCARERTSCACTRPPLRGLVSPAESTLPSPLAWLPSSGIYPIPLRQKRRSSPVRSSMPGTSSLPAFIRFCATRSGSLSPLGRSNCVAPPVRSGIVPSRTPAAISRSPLYGSCAVEQ